VFLAELRVFGALWDVPGCCVGVPRCSEGVPGVFQGCSGVFRGVPGCSGGVPGFTDTPIIVIKLRKKERNKIGKRDDRGTRIGHMP